MPGLPVHRNPVEDLVAPKPIIVVLNKKDLVNPRELDVWAKLLAQEGLNPVSMVATSGEGKSVIKR